jgi:hypothetical protein
MPLFSPISRSFSLLGRIWKSVAAIPAKVLTLAGMASLAGGIVAAQLIQDRGLALTAMGFGAFLGATLLSLYLPKALYGLQQQSESGLRDMRLQLDRAKEEITRLQRTKINVDSFKAISKLALIELDLSVTDYQRKTIQVEAETMFRKERQLVYSGLLRIPVKAHLGVDLSKLKVQEKDGELLVGNLVASHVYEPGSSEWEFDEVRMEHRKNGGVVEVTVDPLDPRSKEHTREHETQIRQRIKEGAYIKAYEEGMLAHAQGVVRQLLAPLGMRISFSKDALNAGVDLQTFLTTGTPATAELAPNLPARK